MCVCDRPCVDVAVSACKENQACCSVLCVCVIIHVLTRLFQPVRRTRPVAPSTQPGCPQPSCASTCSSPTSWGSTCSLHVSSQSSFSRRSSVVVFSLSLAPQAFGIASVVLK